MRFLITCGPTHEPLDQVRRLTNFSSGKLGTELASHLAGFGHQVTLLRGASATHQAPCRGKLREFTTTASLLTLLREHSSQTFHGVFHAAAVSDFQFGQVYRRTPAGELQPLQSGKYTTREGTLLAELIPTTKLLPELRLYFRTAKIFGWKYEVDGTPENAITLATQQIVECHTDYSVVNGPAYGPGFGICTREGLAEHSPSPDLLYAALHRLATAQ